MGIFIKAHDGLIEFRFLVDKEWEESVRRFRSSQLEFDFLAGGSSWKKVVVGAEGKVEIVFRKAIDWHRIMELPKALHDLPAYVQYGLLSSALLYDLMPHSLAEWEGTYFLFRQNNGRVAVKHNGIVERLPDWERDEREEELGRESLMRKARQKREDRLERKQRRRQKKQLPQPPVRLAASGDQIWGGGTTKGKTQLLRKFCWLVVGVNGVWHMGNLIFSWPDSPRWLAYLSLLMFCYLFLHRKRT